jgi:hypothetical protein
VTLSGRTPVAVFEKLVLDSGVVECVSEPAGATVQVNGIVRGTTPCRIDRVPKGYATVVFKLKGYEDEKRELRIVPGDSQSLSLSMRGKAAFVGGHVGKGRVFLSCPHPEMAENTHDLVRSGIKYLTGVAPSPVYFDRVRGALSVAYRSASTAEARAVFYDKILRDRRFDVRTNLDENDFPHADVIVLGSVEKGDDSPAILQFVANGGKVIAVARNKEARATAAKIPGAIVVNSQKKVPAVLEGLLLKRK